MTSCVSSSCAWPPPPKADNHRLITSEAAISQNHFLFFPNRACHVPQQRRHSVGARRRLQQIPAPARGAHRRRVCNHNASVKQHPGRTPRRLRCASRSRHPGIHAAPVALFKAAPEPACLRFHHHGPSHAVRHHSFLIRKSVTSVLGTKKSLFTARLCSPAPVFPARIVSSARAFASSCSALRFSALQCAPLLLSHTLTPSPWHSHHRGSTSPPIFNPEVAFIYTSNYPAGPSGRCYSPPLLASAICACTGCCPTWRSKRVWPCPAQEPSLHFCSSNSNRVSCSWLIRVFALSSPSHLVLQAKCCPTTAASPLPLPSSEYGNWHVFGVFFSRHKQSNQRKPITKHSALALSPSLSCRMHPNDA